MLPSHVSMKRKKKQINLVRAGVKYCEFAPKLQVKF